MSKNAFRKRVILAVAVVLILAGFTQADKLQLQEKLSKEVTLWEDKNALVAGDDEFAIHKRIIQDAHKYLKPNEELKKHGIPQLVLELGIYQEKELKSLLEQAGFSDIKIYKDMEGIYRWITGSL